MNPFPQNNLGNTPVFQSLRLTLRPIHPKDAAQIYSLRSDPENFKYVDFTLYPDIARAQRFITGVTADMAENTVHFWGICLQDSDLLIGTICLWEYADTPKRAEVGYEIMRDHQGKGYAGEALSKIVTFSFEKLQLEELHAITHKDNVPSVALLKRTGFHFIDAALTLNPDCGETQDMMLYTLSPQPIHSL